MTGNNRIHTDERDTLSEHRGREKAQENPRGKPTSRDGQTKFPQKKEYEGAIRGRQGKQECEVSQKTKEKHGSTSRLWSTKANVVRRSRRRLRSSHGVRTEEMPEWVGKKGQWRQKPGHMN